MTNRAREVSNVFQNSGRGKNKNTGKYSPPQPKFQTADYAEGTRIGASLNILAPQRNNSVTRIVAAISLLIVALS
jgi:hypothetical protein